MELFLHLKLGPWSLSLSGIWCLLKIITLVLDCAEVSQLLPESPKLPFLSVDGCQITVLMGNMSEGHLIWPSFGGHSVF